MNPLTIVKRIQNLNSKEATLGISEDASWHAKYRGSAYVFAGGLPFDLTEGDLLAIFAQYGEIVDLNLVRDKGTGKSKGFAFIAYEDQRSTVLAVDNLNGAQVVGRTIRVDHVSNYKKKEEEDEETLQQKREERGVCRAFQRGECTRGDGCKFSHDEKRAANTGWGHEDSKWGHDRFEGRNDREKGVYKEDDRSRNHGTKFDDRNRHRSSKQDDGNRSHRSSFDDRNRKHDSKDDDRNRHRSSKEVDRNRDHGSKVHDENHIYSLKHDDRYRNYISKGGDRKRRYSSSDEDLSRERASSRKT